MPDAITPVGTQVKVDPMQGINMLSGVLGLQQQKLALQTGQARLPGVEAESQQQTQKAQNLQDAQRTIIEAAHSGKYSNSDGSFNRQAAANDVSQIGPYAQEYASQLLSQANEIVSNKQAVQNLTIDRKKEIGSALQSLASNSNVTSSDFIDTIEGLRQQHPNDPEFSRLLTSVSTHVPGHASSAQLQNVFSQMAAMNTGESQLQPTSNAAGQIVNRNRFTGALSMPGASNAGNLNPTSSTVAGNTALSAGASEGDISRSNEVSAKSQAASATVRQSRQVDELADAINSGDIARLAARGAQYAGITSISQARTQLRKDLGQLRGAVASRAGSDARASEILEGYPDDSTPTQTIHAAMDYIRGSARQDLARADLLQRNGRAGFQMADTALTSKTDPLMHEFMALKPEERAGFYRRNFKNAQEAQSFKDSVTAHQKRTQLGVQNGP